jgi:hypothetical protein
LGAGGEGGEGGVGEGGEGGAGEGGAGEGGAGEGGEGGAGEGGEGGAGEGGEGGAGEGGAGEGGEGGAGEGGVGEGGVGERVFEQTPATHVDPLQHCFEVLHAFVFLVQKGPVCVRYNVTTMPAMIIIATMKILAAVLFEELGAGPFSISMG